jgi:hypothetical protein
MAKWTLRPWRPIPWKQFIDPVDRIISDALDDVGEIGLRFDVILGIRLGFIVSRGSPAMLRSCRPLSHPQR